MYILKIENSEYQYAIIRSKKRKKSLSLKISRLGQLEVRSPVFVTDAQIGAWLITRKVWIQKQLNNIESYQENKHSKPNYISGESHFFLGKPYKLMVENTKQAKNIVELVGKNLVVTLSQKYSLPTHKIIEQQIWQWYLEQAHIVFHKRLEKMVQSLAWLRQIPQLTIRKMKSRWGSCSSTGNISLNLHLIRVPVECLDQVILHELCHLKFFNHSKDFYALMAKHNPLYKLHEKQLREFNLCG